MSFNQDALRCFIEKEDRPLKRQADRQAKKIDELTTRISELETKTEEQTELIASLRDERDDALDEMNQTLELLEPWAEYASSLKESKRTEMKQLSEALTKSQANVKQLGEENLFLRREIFKESKATSHASNAPRHASHSDNAAFESPKKHRLHGRDLRSNWLERPNSLVVTLESQPARKTLHHRTNEAVEARRSDSRDLEEFFSAQRAAAEHKRHPKAGSSP
ncbi:MAG: hypothetical protein Q9210_002980 [Variospora velana]